MRIVLFVLLFFYFLTLKAQTNDSITYRLADSRKTSRGNNDSVKIRYKSVSISSPYKVIRDEGQSPLIHKGYTAQIAAYNERWRKKNYTKFEMVTGFGILQTNKKEVWLVTKAYALNLEINYHYLFPVRKFLKEKGNWYVGGIFTNNFDGRIYPVLTNNSFGYEFSNVLNPATHFTYNFNAGCNKRKYESGFKLNFALLAHVIRPNYIGMEPNQTYSGAKINPLALFTHGNKIALPNRFLRINTEIYLDRFKKSNNDKLRVFYGWSMHITNLTNSNPLYYVSHTLGIVSMIYSEKQKKRFKPRTTK